MFNSDDIKKFRHLMRSNGARGACYEVSQFIFKAYNLPVVCGVYQTLDGRPVFEHRWNMLPDGDILDGTADQFANYGDVDVVQKKTETFKMYRTLYTDSFNPQTIDWLKGAPYTGQSDMRWWSGHAAIYTDTPGWWCEDPKEYSIWKKTMYDKYESFRRSDDLIQIQKGI